MTPALSFVSDRPPPGQVDPRDLTAGQLTALGIVAILSARRLVMQRNVNGQPRLEITGTGRNTLAVAEQRKAARHG